MSLIGASPSPQQQQQQHGGGGNNDEGDEVGSVHTHFEEIYDPDYEPTEEEVCDYARYLGFDLDTDRDLLWIARDGLKETLPPEWKSYPSPQSKDSSGREEEVASTVYYFNSHTGESSWLHPCDVKYMDIFKTEKQRMLSLRASTSNAAALSPPPPPPPPPPPLASPSPSAAATNKEEEEEDSPVALVSRPLLQETKVPPTVEDTKRAPSVAKRPQQEEEEDSFVRERLRRLQQENARLRDENQEMRDYAKQKAEEAHESHAKWLVAEYRCRGQEDELARVKNELQANNLEWERRRRRLTQELDETVLRLVQAEEGRDVAERKTRELLLEESTRAKHMEREIEAIQRKMAKAELLQQKTSPTVVNGHRKSQSPQRPQQPVTISSVSSAASAMEGLRSRFD